MIVYKIIKEYTRYYLAEHPSGYKECFLKIEHKPIDNHIYVKAENNYKGGIALPREKVNRNFNPSNSLRINC